MTAPKKKKRPKKPNGSPLTVNPNGQWSKKINGKVCYFGPWEDYEGALKRYHATAGDLRRGKEPAADPSDGMTIRELCNRWLTYCKVDRKIAEGTLRDYVKTAERIIGHFGPTCEADKLEPDDFGSFRKKLSSQHDSPGVLKREIIVSRSPFKFGADNGYIKPAFFGTRFKVPTQKEIDVYKAEKERKDGKRLFESDQMQTLLNTARTGSVLRAMILLAVNCGFGNNDLRLLERGDIGGEWIDYYRRKTGVSRRSKLWPETRNALSEYVRPDPKNKDHSDRVFITTYGNQWGDDRRGNHPISGRFRTLLRQTKIYRRGLSFYTLRHTFQTRAENATKDLPAIKLAMGHKDTSMTANYRAMISDDRLEAIADAVHEWLFD